MSELKLTVFNAQIKTDTKDQSNYLILKFDRYTDLNKLRDFFDNCTNTILRAGSMNIIISEEELK